MIPLEEVTGRLGVLLGDRDAASEVLIRAMRDLALEHAAYLQALGPVRVLALDPCPDCGGTVVAGELDARCRSGCGWSYRRTA